MSRVPISLVPTCLSNVIIWLNMLDKDGLTAEVSVGVTYSALMSAVSLFFTGILISQYAEFDQTIKVPLIYLIISTFSFIFSATIYTNAGTEITLNKLRVVEKYMVYGKNLMELLGLYPFILATPMVIGAITHDSFLRTTTILVAIIGFGLYSQSKFSVLEKELRRSEKRPLTLMVITLSLLMYYFQTAQVEDALFIYSFLSIVLMGLIMVLTYQFSVRSKQYKPVFFREFENEDADRLSKIVHDNLRSKKSKKYSSAVLDSVRDRYSAQSIQQLASERILYVAEFNDRVVGFACVYGNELSSVFTDPKLQRKNIGRLLVSYVENVVAENGDKHITVTASDADHGFYRKLGYQDVKNSTAGYEMKKAVR